MIYADYQLRHRLYGRLGTLWSRQVDKETRNIARGILDLSGNAGEITRTDEVAGSSVGDPSVRVEEAGFRFIDGDFVTIGVLTDDYERFEAEVPPTYYLKAYRGLEPSTSSDPLPPYLARLSDDFKCSLNVSGFDGYPGQSWYLVPVPDGLSPIVIKGKTGYLVSGVDFESHEGYIALRNSPADVLSTGYVGVPVANQRLQQPNSFTLDAPIDRRGSRAMARYSAQSHSLSAFLSAAAEYAGLYVFATPDIVLSKVRRGSALSYVTAFAGHIPINYPHKELNVGEEVQEGHIVSSFLDYVVPDEVLGEEISLDGVLPINDLTYTAGVDVTLQAGNVDPVTGITHIRPLLTGKEGTLNRYWAYIEQQERSSRSYMIENLGLTVEDLPARVDFWDLLQTFYGEALVMVSSDAHRADIDSRLRLFLEEKHPASCVMTHTLRTYVSPGGAFIDRRGRYVPDECVGRRDSGGSGNQFAPSAGSSAIRTYNDRALIGYAGDEDGYVSRQILDGEGNPIPGFCPSITMDGLSFGHDSDRLVMCEPTYPSCSKFLYDRWILSVDGFYLVMCDPPGQPPTRVIPPSPAYQMAGAYQTIFGGYLVPFEDTPPEGGYPDEPSYQFTVRYLTFNNGEFLIPGDLFP